MSACLPGPLNLFSIIKYGNLIVGIDTKKHGVPLFRASQHASQYALPKEND